MALAIIVAVVVLGTSVAQAHEPGFSSVRLAVGESEVEAHLSVPLDLLTESVGLDLMTDPDTAVDEYRAELVEYFGNHLDIQSNGTTWPAEVGVFDVTTLVEDQHLDTVVTFASPSGTIGAFDLTYDVIVDVDPDHQVLVGVTSAEHGVLSGGTLNASENLLAVGADGTSEVSRSAAFFDVVVLGFEHVVEGADHILFLIMLVLPAPLLITRERQWGERASIKHLLRHVLGVSTAFFIGHSATLVLGGFEWVSAPARPVEILIALSIAVGAVHAIRPLARRGEIAIAGLFGLVHGLAFAEILDELAIGGSAILSLLAFNVGVELAQLAAIGLVLPGLVLLSRTSVYQKFRVALAAFSLIAALGWIGERLDLLANPLGAVEEAVIERSLLTVTTFTLAAIAIAFFAKDQSPETEPATASAPG